MQERQITAASSPQDHDRRGGRSVLVVVVLVAAGVAALAVVLGAVLRGGGEDPLAAGETPTDDDGAGTDHSAIGEDTPAVGEVASLPDGAVARVNTVHRDVTLDPGLPAPEPGTRLDRLDVELCAGSGDLFVDAAFWLGHGNDDTVYSAHMGVRDLATIVLAPGGCARGTVDLALPEDVDLEAILLSDNERTTAATWAISDATGDPEPLRSETTPTASALGSAVEPPANGTVTLHELEHTTTGVRIDAERCAGDRPVPTDPQYWYVQLADNRLVRATRDGATMAGGEIPARACDRGTADVTIPAESRVVAVVYADDGLAEGARWDVDA